MSHILLFVGNELSEQTNDTGKRIPRTKETTWSSNWNVTSSTKPNLTIVTLLRNSYQVIFI